MLWFTHCAGYNLICNVACELNVANLPWLGDGNENCVVRRPQLSMYTCTRTHAHRYKPRAQSAEIFPPSFGGGRGNFAKPYNKVCFFDIFFFQGGTKTCHQISPIVTRSSFTGSIEIWQCRGEPSIVLYSTMVKPTMV